MTAGSSSNAQVELPECFDAAAHRRPARPRHRCLVRLPVPSARRCRKMIAGRLPNIHHSAQHLGSVQEYLAGSAMSFKVGQTSIAIALLIAAGLSAAAPARADEAGAPISVKINMARILRIGSPAATVVIGNPGVADVTIQDPQTLILTGKNYGQTNMIVLDQKGQSDCRHAGRGGAIAGRSRDAVQRRPAQHHRLRPELCPGGDGWRCADLHAGTDDLDGPRPGRRAVVERPSVDAVYPAATIPAARRNSHTQINRELGSGR